ncbi:hypothetical protein HY030_02240 [Candidatus Gottesmanbacteria bacterium]|nr:hypothetical protein [Candidatus Gottesmanbacteria bacterium]
MGNTTKRGVIETRSLTAANDKVDLGFLGSKSLTGELENKIGGTRITNALTKVMTDFMSANEVPVRGGGVMIEPNQFIFVLLGKK